MDDREKERIQFIIDNLRESTHVEVKNWLGGLKNNADKANLAKGIIALANSDGGLIFIGFHDKKNSYREADPEPGESEGFSQDVIFGLVDKYVDPPIEVVRLSATPTGSKTEHPVIKVPSGGKIPVLARKGSPDNSSLVTDKLYVRRNASSSPAQTRHDWEGFLDRLVKARQEDMLETWSEMYNSFHGIHNPVQDSNKVLDAAKTGDHETAFREWTPLAEQGDADAQYNLGRMYSEGIGVPQDYKAAAKWCALAAEQGLVEAQLYLGLLYENGNGVSQNYKAAVKWYRLAAEQGDAGAQYNLGLMYYNRKGVTQDYKAGVKWHRRAANQGLASAQYMLGLVYAIGEEIPQDHKAAAKWFRLAAEQGYADAQYSLSLQYRMGWGVERDYKVAAKWHKLAAEQGHAEAQKSN